MQNKNLEYVAILDFGSQLTQLIARRVRELNVFCEVLQYNVDPKELKNKNLKGIILSGGPASVYLENGPKCSNEIFELNVPVLGICYGMQLGTLMLGAKIEAAKAREFGRINAEVVDNSDLMQDVPKNITVWMSHGDQIDSLPGDFEILAKTENCPYAAVRYKKNNFFGVQFHPEVIHTPNGKTMLKNFLYKICNCIGDWTMKSYIKQSIQDIKDMVKNEKVICGISGGIDSAVAAALISKAVGNNLTCIFVDNGLLRKNEADAVLNMLKQNFNLNLIFVNASNEFISALKDITNPEEKRKIIGHKFIDVFEDEANKIKDVNFLAQGTLYPDVIESVSPWNGPSAKIKSHHNVGGLPEKLGFQLVEPLKFLFKDEVRLMANELGFPQDVANRQPFPGPGLAVRIIGEITEERLNVLKEADAIVTSLIEKENLNDTLWQYFAILLPIQSVGVMGDERTYENVAAIRVVESTDGMTADWSRLPYDTLNAIASNIVNNVKGINRVVYDITTKPPSTIEWE